MDYQGYKLIDTIMLVCRDEAEHDDSHGVNRSGCYQAYLVDPANKKQLESARYWAKLSMDPLLKMKKPVSGNVSTKLSMTL